MRNLNMFSRVTTAMSYLRDRQFYNADLVLARILDNIPNGDGYVAVAEENETIIYIGELDRLVDTQTKHNTARLFLEEFLDNRNTEDMELIDFEVIEKLANLYGLDIDDPPRHD